MKKCCFLIPYFGSLPNYFEVFLKTCELNKDFYWKIFTNDKKYYKLPYNVEIIYMELFEFKEIINKKFKCNFPIKDVHKLCDYKPAYGYLFESYISEFISWGHCDLDILVGDLNKFITDDMLYQYDKLFCLGHMIIYKNTFENNRVFMREVNGRKLYLESFSDEKTTIFDETHGNRDNVNTIFENFNKKIYTDDLSFNIRILPTRFIRTRFNYSSHMYDIENYKYAVYIWSDGKVLRYYIENNKLICEEFLYMHFQQRKIKFNLNILNANSFKILPNKFCALEYDDINIKNFKKIKKKNICFHYLNIKIKHLKDRIRWAEN